MSSRRVLVLMTLVLSASMFALIACAGDEAQEPQAPAPAAPAATAITSNAPTTPQKPAAPQPAAPAMPAAQPAAPEQAQAAPDGFSKPPPQRTKGTQPAASAPGFKYVAARATPDSVFVDADYYQGPIPTQFKESPMSAALVKAGKILPLEQRLPVREDVKIYPPSDEIGVYGGVMRYTDTGLIAVDGIFSTSGGLSLDPTGQYMIPSAFKDFQASADGRTYTFTLRKGARWSDGYPVTMENHRFAIEDLTLNKELMPGLPADLLSPITGKDFKFKVIDEWNFQISFDDPQFSFSPSSAVTVYSGQRGCPRCFISPSHVFKRYHTKYNAAEIPALLTKHNQPDWVRLFTFVRNVRAFSGIPSTTIPTTYDPNYIYKGDHYIPWRGSWITKSYSPGRNIFERNHYFFGVDPEGNQLPYLDGVEQFVVESRDVAVFRMMAGEADFNRNALDLSELPLYLANMDKGDYTVMKYPALDGGDTIIGISQEVQNDMEVGALLRTYDFRLALSKAWNRVSANESLAAGLAVPQNIAPHPSTPYAPDDKVRYLNIQRDVAGAKALLAKLGYKDANDDGYLDRKDGGGRLRLHMESYGPYLPYIQLLQGDLREVGIELTFKENSTTFASQNRIINPTLYYEWSTHTEGGVNPWSSGNQRFIPIATHQGFPGAGTYFSTRGEQGVAPTGPDPKWKDAYGTMAPAGTYPADISGYAKTMQNMYVEGQVIGTFSPRRIELGKALFRTNAELQMHVNGLAYSGILRALRTKRNNLRNVPRNGTTGNSPSHDMLYFEDGIDNLNNPGNRSKKYKSVSFLDAAYWNPVLGQ